MENQKGAGNILPIIVGFLTLLVFAGVGFYFISGRKNTETTQAENQTAQVEGTQTETQPIDEKTFTVEGGEFYFEPNEIRVKKGERVTINFTNANGFHDFVLDEFNIRIKQIPAGGSETVSFIADKEGTFEYYCSVGQHRQNGMVGSLIVSP